MAASVPSVSAAPTAAAAGEHLAWANVARAGCILAVILFHTIRQHYLRMPWADGLAGPAMWGQVNRWLYPIRMPLFFTVSGMLAGTALRRPWEEVKRSRFHRPFYLYGVWGLIYVLFFSFGPETEPGFAAASLSTKLMLLCSGVSMAWYLSALALFFFAAWLLRGVPTAPLLVATLVLAVAAASGLLDGLPWAWRSMARCAVFFVAGARSAAVLRRQEPVVAPLHALAAAVLFAALLRIGERHWLGLIALDASGVWLGLSLSFVAARIAPVARLGARLGTRTLPVYVLHFPVLASVAACGLCWLPPAMLADPLVALAYPPLIGGATLALALWLHRILDHHAGAWLFGWPFGDKGAARRGTELFASAAVAVESAA